MDKFGGIVWLTHFDHLEVPFYQAFDFTKTKAMNGRFAFGIGEVIGTGERHQNMEQIEETFKLHEVGGCKYEMYMQMKAEKPLQTAGFRLGSERFLLWVLKYDDTCDCQILPRFNFQAPGLMGENCML